MIRSRERLRWGLLGLLFGLTWLASGAGVPVYDGIGAPDEPYRHVPPVAGASTPPATTATGRLTTAGGLTIRGLNVNSAETGPQVSVFIPPYSLAVPGSAESTVTVVARPVEPTGTAAPGTAVSNVYEVSLTSPAGPVTVQTSAQSPGITLRATDAQQPTPVMRYRPDPSSPWRALDTKRLGFDIYHSDLPGAGSFVLSRDTPTTVAAKPARGSSMTWLVVLGLVLVAPLLAVVRLMTRRPE